MLQAFLLLALGGVFAGLIAGLLGVGGGIILVPLLTIILPFLGIASDLAMHVAIATSLAVIAMTSISSARVHVYCQQPLVNWYVFRKLTAGTVVGTLTGVNIVHFLPNKALHIFFGLFTLVIAIRTLFDIRPKQLKEIPRKYTLLLSGFILGNICTILGMGGGTLIVPFLSRYNISMRNIIPTSSLCTIPIAWMGVLGYVLVGYGYGALQNVSWTTGYIYWPAFLATAAAGIIFAPLGAKLAHRLSSKLLKQIFGIFLVAVSAHMLTIGFYH